MQHIEAAGLTAVHRARLTGVTLCAELFDRMPPVERGGECSAAAVQLKPLNHVCKHVARGYLGVISRAVQCSTSTTSYWEHGPLYHSTPPAPNNRPIIVLKWRAHVHCSSSIRPGIRHHGLSNCTWGFHPIPVLGNGYITWSQLLSSFHLTIIWPPIH
jgi:hypothetical protein